MTDTVYIGSGAGFAGDRFDAAIPVVETLSRRDGPRYLVYEVMGERTLAIAQRLRQEDPEGGYSPYLDRYLGRVLPACKSHGVRIVTNMGGANPRAAARRVHALAKELGVTELKVAVVLGDDLLGYMDADAIRSLPAIEGIATGDRAIIAANAYLGARPVADALALGADIVLVGRTTDPALVLGPLLHEFGWAADDWDRLAAGTVAGHLLECGGQVTGGYFCDPGFKDVPGMADLGFPVGEIGRSGNIVVAKADGTGGLVSRATVIEQLLYEMHDPRAYLTPDVTLDITGVLLEENGDNRICVSGARGAPPPDTLKATVSTDGGWLGEAEMIYAGPNALARARLAADIVRERCARIGSNTPIRLELLGAGAAFGGGRETWFGAAAPPADGEYRLRAAIRTIDRALAQHVTDEVQSLFCSGPAGGGGFRSSVSAQISTSSVLVDTKAVEPHIHVELVEP